MGKELRYSVSTSLFSKDRGKLELKLNNRGGVAQLTSIEKCTGWFHPGGGLKFYFFKNFPTPFRGGNCSIIRG